MRLGLGDVLAGEDDRPLGDLVPGMSQKCVRKRRLAGPVGAHEGMDLALVDAQVYALEDLQVLDADV